MKNILMLLVMVCLFGCESKTEKEVQELEIRKTDLNKEVKEVNQEMVSARLKLAKVYTETADNIGKNIHAQDQYQRKVSEIQKLEKEKALALNLSEQELANYLASKTKKVYILKLKIKQRSYSLNPLTHAKNAMNAMEIEIPVAEEYYQHHNIGDELASDFRVGSAVLHGAMGELVIKVSGKRTEEY